MVTWTEEEKFVTVLIESKLVPRMPSKVVPIYLTNRGPGHGFASTATTPQAVLTYPGSSALAIDPSLPTAIQCVYSIQ